MCISTYEIVCEIADVMLDKSISEFKILKKANYARLHCFSSEERFLTHFQKKIKKI